MGTLGARIIAGCTIEVYKMSRDSTNGLSQGSRRSGTRLGFGIDPGETHGQVLHQGFMAV